MSFLVTVQVHACDARAPGETRALGSAAARPRSGETPARSGRPEPLAPQRPTCTGKRGAAGSGKNVPEPCSPFGQPRTRDPGGVTPGREAPHAGLESSVPPSARPPGRGYLHDSQRPSATTFQSVFMVVTAPTGALAPQPRRARGLGAWKQAPPRAAVAAARGLLSLSHGQVTQRGAAATAAAAPARPGTPPRAAPRPAPPRPRGPRPPRHLRPVIGGARAAAQARSSHWPGPPASPAIARHCLRPPEKAPSYWRRRRPGGGRAAPGRALSVNRRGPAP